MIRHFLTAVALTVLAGCSGGSGTPTDPSNPGPAPAPAPAPAPGPTPAPLTAAVSVGNIFFRSGHNGSANPAVDTVAVGGTVTWTWANAGSVPHSIQSLGLPSFTSSAIITGDGSTYQVQFTAPGTYQYDCVVHGTMMSGTIIVR
jgi:plastocyanin